jgi:hypothetical protein
MRLLGVDDLTRRAVEASWPRVRWLGRGPMRFWWLSAVTQATVIGICWWGFTGDGWIALLWAFGLLLVGIPLWFLQYRKWLLHAAGTQTWIEKRRLPRGPFPTQQDLDA